MSKQYVDLTDDADDDSQPIKRARLFESAESSVSIETTQSRMPLAPIQLHQRQSQPVTDRHESAASVRDMLLTNPDERCRILNEEINTMVSFDRLGYGWCHTTRRKPSKKNGYPQVYVRQHKPYTLHQLVWLHYSGREPPNPIKDHQHISHLCGNSQCMNPLHLHVENAVDNNQRKGCIVWVVCPEGDECQYRGIIVVCSHTPRCIRHHPQFDDHEHMDSAIPDSCNHFVPSAIRNNKIDGDHRSDADNKRLKANACSQNRAVTHSHIIRGLNSIDAE